MVYGRVYSIRSHQTTDIYIGSTTQILCRRMSDHCADYKRYLDGKRNYISSFEILKHKDAYIELIFEKEFVSKLEMQKREGQEIRDTICVNKNIAGREPQEYRQENKEIINERDKNYCKLNKEKIAEHKKEYYVANKEKIDEHHRQYRENNEKKIKENRHNHYETNKEQINKRNKIKFTCECGSVCRIVDKSQHNKTKKHQLFIQNQNLNIVPV
jgi:hypothetical protein